MEDNPKLKPYLFHGVSLYRQNGNEVIGDCPFCDREGKFSINLLTEKWRCWSCSEGSDRGGGNKYTFIQKFHQLCFDATKSQEYDELVENRGFMDSQCLIEWQLVKSTLTNDWLVPGYNQDKKLVTLYRYIHTKNDGYRLLPTPTLGHHIHGMNLWDSRKPIVYICEGPWDAIALWEVLGRAKNSEHGLVPTASRESSLLSQCNVIAVPGCEVFFETWLPLFENKIVNLMFDSDHPRKNSKTGKISDGAGLHAMKRTAAILASTQKPPVEINYLHWGDEGYDPKLKSGFDVRDMILKG